MSVVTILSGAARLEEYLTHEFEYDLLSENEKIISATTDVAIDCFKIQN